jgi:hypothetical protein
MRIFANPAELGPSRACRGQSRCRGGKRFRGNGQGGQFLRQVDHELGSPRRRCAAGRAGRHGCAPVRRRWPGPGRCRPCASRPERRLEQVFARLFRQARGRYRRRGSTIPVRSSPADDLDGAGLRRGLDGLAGVADQVREHPEELLAVGAQHQVRRDVDQAGHKAAGGGIRARPSPSATSPARAPRETGVSRRRRLLGLAEGQRRFAQLTPPG